MKFDCKACQVSARQSITLANWIKKDKGSQTHTAQAAVESRRVAPARFPTPGSTWTYWVSFTLADGTKLELSTFEETYTALEPGMTGTLTWQGETFLGLDTEDGKEKP